MIVIGLMGLCLCAAPILYAWEKRRDAHANRFEDRIAALARQLGALDEGALSERLRQHRYFTAALREQEAVVDFFARVGRREYGALVGDWERLTRRFVEAEQRAGGTGTPRLVEHEWELAALVRLLAQRTPGAALGR